jgi:hypothetical protein
VSPTGLELMTLTSDALTAQYLNFHPHRLGTIITQTLHIVQHDTSDTGSLPKGEFLHGQPNLLLNNLAHQKYRNPSIPKEAALHYF